MVKVPALLWIVLCMLVTVVCGLKKYICKKYHNNDISVKHPVGSDLGPNCSLRQSMGDKSWHWREVVKTLSLHILYQILKSITGPTLKQHP